jgi:hypothetical protein
MSAEKQQKWFQARLRWAMMEEGRGLIRWQESEHIFRSDSRATAFQEALRIGRAKEYSLIPDERNEVAIDYRFAEVTSLEEPGRECTAFEVYLGERKATERIDFDHAFDPEAGVPMSVF